MISRLWTAFLLSLACASTIAWLVALMHEKDVRPVRDLVAFFKKQSKAGRVILGTFFIAMWMFASVKPGDGGGNGGGNGGGDGGTNNVEMVVGPGGGLQPLDSPGAVTNNQQQGFQGGVQSPQGGLVGDPAPVTDPWENFTPITSTNTTRTLEGDDFRRGFVLARVGTGEAFTFAAPDGANVCADWRAFGAAEDWIYLAFEDLAFRLGTNEVDRLRVFSFGKVDPLVRDAEGHIATNCWFAPFVASLGIVPQANWPLVAGNENAGPEDLAPSQFWHLVTPSNTLQLTWQNVLLDRLTNTPVSVQMEVWPSGRFTYRYDLSRLDVDEVTNVLVGACLGGLEWATNSIPTNLTSLAFYPLSPEDAANGDRDGDGLSLLDELFAFGTDPDLRDTSGDGISDGEAVSLGLDPLLRHVPDADILARVASSATNEAFLAGNVVSTNVLAAWALLDGFAADWPPGATNVLWERSFDVERTSAWQQYFVSASPSNAAPWCLDGLLLEWTVDGETRGSLAVSPAGDSWRVPLAPDDFPTNITLRLRATGAGGVRCPTPLHLAAYAPDFRVDGGQVVTGQSGKRFFVFTEGSDSQMQLVVDHERRPHRAPPTVDEGDMELLDMFSMSLGVSPFPGDMTGGALTACQPGVYALPELTLGTPGTTGVSPVGNRGFRGGNGSLIVLSPCVGWRCENHGCGYDGLGYSEEGGYYEESYFPLDSKCLRRAWHRSWGGGGDGWTHENCEMCVYSGVEEGDEVSSEVSDGRGRVYVDGVEVWSGTAEHVYDDVCGGGGDGGYGEDFLGDGCDSCGSGPDPDCPDGDCGGLEGASLGSLKFRIPLGRPVKGQVAGFAWFSADGPLYISPNTFQVLGHPDAHIADTTVSGIRQITCSDSRGRNLRIESIAHGVRITIYDAAQTLEHIWVIVNEDGDPAQVRLTKISRLDNIMSDETFAYDSGVWIRFDNVAEIGTRLSSSGDYSVWGDNEVTETRETYDAADTPLGTVTTVKRRVGECDNAVLRETYREEDNGWNVKWSRADYWNDPQHAGRHGQPRLVWGNARAWTYMDYDEFGHETLRVEQRGSASVPEAFPYVVSNVLYDASTLANAFVTVRDFEPPSGDSRHPDDAARPRAETRYVVTNGVATLVARTQTRYTRLTRDGYAAIKKETWRGGSTSSATDAYSYEITYASTGIGTPLLMRGAVAESLSEDGILTVNAYTLTGSRLTCESRRFGPETGDVRREFKTYETTETDAAYGTILRRTTRLTSNDTIIADEQSIYDDQNRLRSTTFLDGTSLTNAYSCCRLLWKRDREGRKVLRSARTGTDHLYYAMEDVWLADVSTNGQYRVTQHFYDALGRETNRVVYAGSAPGEATVASASDGKAYTTVTTTYPYGGDDYSVSTDERGRVTIRRVDILADCTETDETVFTNGVEVVKTKSRSYFGGGSSTRREWPGGSQLAATAWTEERRFTDYAADGSRIDYVVTESSDCGVVTNSVSTYDLLGRLVTIATPTGATGVSPVSGWNVTSNAYDGATSRILTATFAAGDVVRTTHYIYNDIGEQVGTILDGVTNRTDVTYGQFSNEWWKVETTVVIGPSTNSITVTRTQLTGLSDFCRRHTITLTGGGDVARAPSPLPQGRGGLATSALGTTTDSLTSYDPATGIETETITSSTGPTIIRRSLHGVLLSTETSGETTFNSYDAFARVAATSRTGCQSVQVGSPIGEAALLPLQSYDYSPCGDLLATHTYTNDTDYTTETYAYDLLGNRIATTDALGNTTYRTFDPLGQVTAEWGATYPVLYTYDTQGRRISLSTTRDGTTWDTTTWTYDPYTGLCTSKIYADTSTVTYTYTPDKLPLRTTYASGKWKENVYDAQRRLCGVIYSSPDKDYELQLDAYGNTTNVSDAAGNAWRYEYGFDSQLLSEEYITTGGTRSCASAATNSISRSYDSFDRPTGYALTVNDDPKGNINYAYDDDNRISYITATNSAGRSFTVAYTNNAGYNYGYTITTPSGNTIRRVVDRDEYRRNLVTNCATYFNASPVDSNRYVFDALSRPTARTTGTTGILPVASSFAYNNRSEVVSAAIGTNYFTHVYDDIGNQLLFGDNAATNTFTHNALNQIVGRAAPSAPPTTFTYTSDGGLANDGTWSFTYDAEDQLSSVTSSSLTNGAIRVLNTYDYRHRRTSKTVQRLYSTIPPPPVPPAGTQEWETIETRTFVYDDWNLTQETIFTIDGGTTNTIEAQYFWGLDLSDALQGAGGVGGLLAVSRNGHFYFPTFDNNGNVTKYIDAFGNIVAAYEYDDFGRIVSQSGSLADFFRHRFSTKYYDPEMGQYYYDYRFYYSHIIRWLNQDPIGEEGGLMLYGYCMNNATAGFDPFGLYELTLISDYTLESDVLMWYLHGNMGNIIRSNIHSESQLLDEIRRANLKYGNMVTVLNISGHGLSSGSGVLFANRTGFDVGKSYDALKPFLARNATIRIWSCDAASTFKKCSNLGIAADALNATIYANTGEVMPGPDGDALLRLSQRVVAWVMGEKLGEWRIFTPRPRMEARGFTPGPRAFKIRKEERKLND